MQATQILRDEHEGIMAMLAVVESAAQHLQKGQAIPPDFMPNAVGFFRNFADRCHHGKEEDELFPALVARGVPKEGGPVGMMLIEHDQGRELIRGMDQAAQRYAAGDATVVPALVENSLGYVNLLRAHIFKENNILFPMAERMFSDEEQSELFDAFEEIERTRTGPGEHERYHAMIAEYQKIAAGWG